MIVQRKRTKFDTSHFTSVDTWRWQSLVSLWIGNTIEVLNNTSMGNTHSFFYYIWLLHRNCKEKIYITQKYWYKLTTNLDAHNGACHATRLKLLMNECGVSILLLSHSSNIICLWSSVDISVLYRHSAVNVKQVQKCHILNECQCGRIWQISSFLALTPKF